jgi:hypothetical protein
MSLNIVSRLALAFGALTIATLPAFAETSPSVGGPAATVAAPSAATTKPAIKHHAKRAALHHKKAVKKDAIEKTGLTPAAPADAEATAKPKL